MADEYETDGEHISGWAMLFLTIVLVIAVCVVLLCGSREESK